MGVRGLLTYCLERRDLCSETVDLVEIARLKGGIELLVDLCCFQYSLLEKLWESLSKVSGNDLLRILGGEYQALDDYVSKLVKVLRGVDIHLVMYRDGGEAAPRQVVERKFDTWRARYEQNIGHMNTLLRVCSGQLNMSEIGDASARPVLFEAQIDQTLKRLGCEVVVCMSGEADGVLARELHTRPRAYAILSNDSDFCVFKNSRFIPDDLFDLGGDLGLGGSHLLPLAPGLPDMEALVEVSVLSDNDFTKPHVYGLRVQLGLKKAKIGQVAEWVKENGPVNGNVLDKARMNENHKLALKAAIQQSRDFYALKDADEPVSSHNPVGRVLEEGVETCKFPCTVLGMHRHLYWHRELLEDCGPRLLPVEFALIDLRRHIYKIVLQPRGDNRVEEFGRGPNGKLKPTVTCAVDDAQVPPLNCIHTGPDKIAYNLKTFHHIMTHYQALDSSVNYFDEFGLKSGFICYTLRYLLSIAVKYQLKLDEAEAIPLVAMVLGNHDNAWYQSLRVLPTSRCVTIGNWFQAVCLHTYNFLGRLLYLSEEFPEPCGLFSGSVWTAFYMVSTRQADVPPETSDRVWSDMEAVTNLQQAVVGQIVRGFFTTK